MEKEPKRVIFMHIHAVQRGMDIACKMLKQLEESGVWEHVSHLSLGLVGERPPSRDGGPRRYRAG